MEVNNYKSLFILHAYSSYDENMEYCIELDGLKEGMFARPGFELYEWERGYYQNLRDAEKRIRQLAKNKQGNIHSFLIEERPMDFPLIASARLSSRRYLKNGVLWQVSEVSSVRFKGQKRCRLGDTCFHGRDPKTILFEEGDIVELVFGDFVELAIVRKMPATVEQIEKFCERKRLRKWDERPVQCLGNLSDSYSLVRYSVSKDGRVESDCFEYPVVNVLPASNSVPKKIATELRKQLKIAKNLDDDELPF